MSAAGAGCTEYAIEAHPHARAIASSMIREVADAGLGLAPGAAFGPEGEGYLRWCFAADEVRPG